jgi:hypothetical protein
MFTQQQDSLRVLRGAAAHQPESPHHFAEPAGHAIEKLQLEYDLIVKGCDRFAQLGT